MMYHQVIIFSKFPAYHSQGTMTAFDAIILIISLIFVIRGIWVGFVRQIAFLIALPLGFIAASAFYRKLGHLLLPIISNPQASFLVTYILLFIATYLVIIIIGKTIRKIISITLLGWFDRTMGGIFGLVKALFLSSLIYMILSGFASSPEPMFGNSVSASYLAGCSKYMLSLIKDNDLRHRFVPKKPAISTILIDPAPMAESLDFNTEIIPQ